MPQLAAAQGAEDQQFAIGKGPQAMIEGPGGKLIAVVVDGDMLGVGRALRLGIENRHGI